MHATWWGFRNSGPLRHAASDAGARAWTRAGAWRLLNANQRAALISFVYNLGAGTLSGETMTRTLVADKNTLATWPTNCLIFNKGWDPALKKKVTVPGILNRRTAEAALWKGESEFADKTLVA